jgi:hypothetical protein
MRKWFLYEVIEKYFRSYNKPKYGTMISQKGGKRRDWLGGLGDIYWRTILGYLYIKWEETSEKTGRKKR